MFAWNVNSGIAAWFSRIIASSYVRRHCAHRRRSYPNFREWTYARIGLIFRILLLHVHTLHHFNICTGHLEVRAIIKNLCSGLVRFRLCNRITTNFIALV